MTTGRNIPFPIVFFLEVFDEDESDGDWQFRELVGSFTWLSNQTRPSISNALRAVARYTHAPILKYWQDARGIMEEYLKVTSSNDITFQRRNELL